MNKIFLDFDGTLFEFRKGVGPDTYSARGYSRTLKPYDNVIAAIKEIAKERLFEIYLCSAVLPYDYIIEDKNWCLDEHLPVIPLKNRLYVKYGESKVEAIRSVGVSEGDVFLDDYNPNLWDIKKAIKEIEPIKLVNDINDQSHEWKGPKVHYDTDAESIALTLYGLSLARRNI